MRHFHRSTLRPDDVLASAEQYFANIGLTRSAGDAGTRAAAPAGTRLFSGALGSLTLRVRMEGGHYTMVEGFTDQMYESRLDKNVKNFFASLHRIAEPRHRIEAGF